MALANHTSGSVFDDANLLAYYKLSDATDSGPGGKTLTAVATPTFVAGKYGNCVNYVRASSQGHVRDDTYLTENDNYTISQWLLPASVPASGELYTSYYIAHNTHGLQIYSFYRNLSGTVKLFADRYLYGVGSSNLTWIGTLSTTAWTHFCTTYDGTNCRMYVNSELKDTLPKQTGTTNGFTTRLTLGTIKESSTVEHFWNGKIDEFLIFTRAWTAQEVYNYYQQYRGMMAGANY